MHAWAFAGDCDPSQCVSKTSAMEWPPQSGIVREFPEIDRVEIFGVSDARRKVKFGQDALISELKAILKSQTD